MENDTARRPHFVMKDPDCATIVFADGANSQDLFSKEEARDFLAEAVKRGFIAPENQKQIEDEIKMSRLREVLSLQTKILLEAVGHLRGIRKDLDDILDQEFGGMPRDSFSSKNESDEDDSTYIPGNKTIH